MIVLQAETFNWFSLLPQLLLTLVPAAAALTATYLTLSHQRKVKADELAASTSLKARELMFGVYEKRLDDLTATAETLSQALGDMHASTQVDLGDEKVYAAVSRFFSVMYSQTLKLPEYIEETESELAKLGLDDKFKEQLDFIKIHRFIASSAEEKQTPKEVMDHVYDDVLRPFSYMINIQRAILEAKADELFGQFLPEKSRRMIHKKGSDGG